MTLGRALHKSAARTPLAGDAARSAQVSGVGMAGAAAVVGAAATGAGAAEESVRRGRVRLPVLVSAVILVLSMVLSIALGAVTISPADQISTLLGHLPLIGFHSGVAPIEQAIIWDLRLPRVVLAALVGAMLAGGGAAYQGVLRNSLADPYLLGVAAGAGLGATVVIVLGGAGTPILPVAAFVGAVAAVALTYTVAAAGTERAGGYALILAGVAAAAMLTAIQTYLQQQHADQMRQIYNWILGSFAVASWSDIWMVAPYIAISVVVLLAHRRILDVLRVGGDEATTLGVDPRRAGLAIIGAATLGTAAAVSVSGLIGFVGIVAPHAVRLVAGASYRVVLPVSMICGGAFLVLADLVARTVQAPAEVPIGVITAFVGGPFFLLVLRSRRSRHGVL
ncbi:MAG: iron ABC transporter permease [Actinobacteria bacterium]|jgi:iron complex transport system permease protein|nr:iron ABC transporter permease [Actinomycetota bacterium]